MLAWLLVYVGSANMSEGGEKKVTCRRGSSLSWDAASRQPAGSGGWAAGSQVSVRTVFFLPGVADGRGSCQARVASCRRSGTATLSAAQAHFLMGEGARGGSRQGRAEREEEGIADRGRF